MPVFDYTCHDRNCERCKEDFKGYSWNKRCLECRKWRTCGYCTKEFKSDTPQTYCPKCNNPTCNRCGITFEGNPWDKRCMECRKWHDCEHCHEEFENPKPRQYCLKCRTKTCEQCGKEFDAGDILGRNPCRDCKELRKSKRQSR